MAREAWDGIITNIYENSGKPLVEIQFDSAFVDHAMLPASLFDMPLIGEKVTIIIEAKIHRD